MRVGLVVEAKVTGVLRLVDRLREGAQQHGLNNMAVVASLHPAK